MKFPLLSPRSRDSHKGMFGHAVIIGGSPGMVGAALLAGRAALHCGAGRVTLGVLDERVAVDAVQAELMFAPPEQIASGTGIDVLAIGPGLGQSEWALALMQKALAARIPLVIDADGLNLIASHPALQMMLGSREQATLLTPHPGEAARLLGCSTKEIQARREDSAQRLAARYGAIVALKGAGTVIATPDGNATVNATGCPAMASPGMGDVLTGLTAGLIAQGVNPLQALDAAVCLHGAAGELVWKEKGQPPSITASAVIEAMPRLLSRPCP
jgi:hydroxyethylthiazole kinase-like uncharacterized protein yjeF